MAYGILDLALKILPILALLVAVLRILGWDPPRPVIGCLAWAAGLTLFIKTFWFSNFYLCDFLQFYNTGSEVLAGRNPYLGQVWPTAPNPPSVQPICVAFAAFPFRWAGMAWALLNIAGMLALVEGARRVLNAQGGLGGREIPAETTAGLMPALVLSTGLREGLVFGNLHILTTWALMGAMLARACGRPILAGLGLALATVKPHTMLPFLILFRRKSDWPTWVALAAATLALVASTTPPAEIPQRIQTWRTRVKEINLVGINDYSDASPISYNMISLPRVLYGLGLRDRGMIDAAHFTLLGLLGAGLAFEILRRRRISESASCALLSCYALLLIYHRTYDGAVLALPLVYAAAGARSSRGVSRALFIAAAMCLLLTVNPYGTIQGKLLTRSWSPGVGWLIHAFIIPFPTWALLLAMLGLWLAIRREPPAVASPA